MSRKNVYLTVVHSKHPLIEDGKLIDGKFQLIEQVYVSNNIKPNVLSKASLIINIEAKSFVKSRSEYENVGKETVIDHYITEYMPEIQKFYKKVYGNEFVS